MAIRKLAKLNYKVDDEVVASFGKGGWIKVLLRTIEHENFQGSWTKYSFPWVVLDRGNSIAILLRDIKRNEIVLVQQFRPAILGTIFELVAGTIAPGEDPGTCVRREVQEEVGLNVGEIRLISKFYVSPGATSEAIIVYYAEVESLGEDGMVSGLKEEGENIQKNVISVTEALKMLSLGIIDDAKTIIALQWLKGYLGM